VVSFSGLELLATAVVALDEGFVVRYANPAAESLLATGVKSLIGQRFPSVQVTRLARGLPAGSSIEYANRNILADAISGRQRM